MATAEAAKSLVAVIQPISRAAVLPEPLARARLRAELCALAHTVGAIPIGARKRAQTGVVIRQTRFHLASHADIARRRRRGRATAAAGRAAYTLLLDELARITRVQIKVVGVRAVLHGPRAVAVGAEVVAAVAVGPQHGREGVEVLQGRARAGALGAEGRAGLDVVALVGDVVWVAEDEPGADWKGMSVMGSSRLLHEDSGVVEGGERRKPYPCCLGRN